MREHIATTQAGMAEQDEEGVFPVCGAAATAVKASRTRARSSPVEPLAKAGEAKAGALVSPAAAPAATTAAKVESAHPLLVTRRRARTLNMESSSSDASDVDADAECHNAAVFDAHYIGLVTVKDPRDARARCRCSRGRLDAGGRRVSFIMSHATRKVRLQHQQQQQQQRRPGRWARTGCGARARPRQPHDTRSHGARHGDAHHGERRRGAARAGDLPLPAVRYLVLFMNIKYMVLSDALTRSCTRTAGS